MNDTQLSWGRIKFGREPRRSAVLVAIPCGLIIATVFALLTTHFHADPSQWWFNVTFYWGLSAPVATSAAWLALVDPSTIRGAVRKPEDTIERMWAKNATFNAYLVTMAIFSIALAVCTAFGYQQIANVLIAVVSTQVLVGLSAYMYETRRK